MRTLATMWRKESGNEHCGRAAEVRKCEVGSGRMRVRTSAAMPRRRRNIPPHAALVRFLTRCVPVPLSEAARLLGRTEAEVRLGAAANGALIRDGLVPWSEVAFELFAAWPRALILDTLGNRTDVVPAGLHLTQPGWSIPAYIVRAMEEQSRTVSGPGGSVRGVDDYVADLLHQAIDPSVITELLRDPAFLVAYDYPDGGGEE